MSLPKRPQDLSATAVDAGDIVRSSLSWESPVGVLPETHVADVDIAAICIAWRCAVYLSRHHTPDISTWNRASTTTSPLRRTA